MSLQSDFEASGSWLFRHRSYLGLTGLPLLLACFASFTYFGQEHTWDELWNAFCMLVSLSGLALRVMTVGHVPKRSSGRNTRTQVASSLNTTGVYSVVRHPLYLANYIMVLGIALFFHTWWVVALVTCACVLYYERIIFAEELYLSTCFGEDFKRWAAATPTVIPNLALWKRPKLPFSWRSVLRREYTGLALVTTIFPLLEVTGDSVAEKRLRLDWPWLVLAALGVLAYLVLRSLKKHTRCLDEADR